MNDPRFKGEIAQLKVQQRALELGLVCSRPTMDGARYDLIIDDGQALERVQIKYADGKGSHASGAVRVELRRRSSDGRGQTRCYSREEVDALIVYVPSKDQLLRFPPEAFEGKSALHVRFDPSKNNQAKGVFFAEPYVW